MRSFSRFFRRPLSVTMPRRRTPSARGDLRRAAVLLALCVPARALAVPVTLNPTGGMFPGDGLSVTVSDTGKLQVSFEGAPVLEQNSINSPFVSLGTSVYGATFLEGNMLWGSSSVTDLGGAGTGASPYRARVNATFGMGGTVAMTSSYVAPNEYVDVDVHHGDGVQAAFWDDPRVLTISLHESGRSLFPGTGYPTEIGGPGAIGSAVNIALPPGTDDNAWLRAFHGEIGRAHV